VELVIRMKTVTRTLLLLGFFIVWLLALISLDEVLLLEALPTIGAALGLALLTTVLAAWLLRT